MAKGKKGSRRGEEEEEEEAETEPQQKGGKQGKRGKGRKGRLGDDDDFFPDEDEPQSRAEGVKDGKATLGEEDEGGIPPGGGGSHKSRKDKKKGKAAKGGDEEDDDQPGPKRLTARDVEDAEEEEQQEEEEEEAHGRGPFGGRGGKDRKKQGISAAAASASFALLADDDEGEEDGDGGDEGSHAGGSSTHKAAGGHEADGVEDEEAGMQARKGQAKKSKGKKGRRGGDDDFWGEFEDGSQGPLSAAASEAGSAAAASDERKGAGKKGKKGRKGRDADFDDEFGLATAGSPEPVGLVVGEVLSAQRIPKSDKLKLCLVDCGKGEPVQIVCGGRNVREGLKVIVAPVGAALPCNGRVLEQAVVRGEESFGMICSAVEMGWAESAEDVVELDKDAPVGSAAPLQRPGGDGWDPAKRPHGKADEDADEGGVEEEISFSGRKRGKKKGKQGGGLELLAIDGEEDAQEPVGVSAGRRKGRSAALGALLKEVGEGDEAEQAEDGSGEGSGATRPLEKPRKGKKAGTSSALEALMMGVEEGEGNTDVAAAGASLAPEAEKRKKVKKKGMGSALEALMMEVEAGASEEGSSEQARGATHGEELESDEDTSLAFAGKKRPSKGRKAKSAGAPEASGAEPMVDEGTGSASTVPGADQEGVEAGRGLEPGGGKKKGKKGKGPKAADPDDDIDAILAQLEEPKASAADAGGKGKKGKKSSRTAEEEAELDSILAELEGPKAQPQPVPSPAPQAPGQGEDAAAETGAAGATEEAPAPTEGDGEGEGEAAGGAESAAAKKKKKKKEKEKLKKEAAKEAGKGEEDAKKEEEKDLKKLPKHVRELQEKLARMRELEERQRREEEERQRKEEEEAARLAELERQREEAKRRKKEKEKERIAQLKKEGKYLTGKKKEEARRLQALREQLLATAGLSEPSSEASSSAPVEDEGEVGGGAGAGGGGKKTKVVYDSRKKRGPRANSGTAAPLSSGVDSGTVGAEAQAGDGDLVGAASESTSAGPSGTEEDGRTAAGPAGTEVDGASLPPLEGAQGDEQAEAEVSAAQDNGEQGEAQGEEGSAEEWDAKSWDADDVELPALKRKGAFDDEEELEEIKQVAKKEASGGPSSGKAKSAAVKAAPKTAKPGQRAPAAAQNLAAKAKPAGAKEEGRVVEAKGKDEEDEEDEEGEEGSKESEESDEDSGSGSEDDSDDEERKKREARGRREKRRQQALAQRSSEDLRSPICCILGHVDTGKTKLLDCIRRTNVQEGEAGGITQQIGATYFPMENIRERTKELKADATLKVPGLLVIDTPGHESFTNLRSRGSGLCDIAVLVVDIMHGLEPQTIESLNLLKMRKTPFVVAMNKVDRIYGWKPSPNAPIRASLKHQNRDAVHEFETRCKQVIMELNQQGMNAELYYKNQDIRKYLSIVPTSALTGEGVPDLLLLLVQLTQKMMEDKLMYISDVQCTVLEVKVVEGLGTTIDVVLINGVLHEGDQIVVCGLNGPIVTTIRALLTPHPMKELRVKGSFQHHKELKAAIGIKITAQGLEHAVAGTQLYVVGPDDDVDELMEEAMEDVQGVLARVDKSGEGVCVQASTLGSLEALLEFLKSPAVSIPVSGIAIGPIHKKDVMRASVMLERKRKEYAVILAFDVKVSTEAKELAEELGVRIFTADIIYHLFDQFTAYMQRVKDEKKQEAAEEAVFPVVLKILPNCIFNKKDPIVLGVEVLDGIAKVGTPLCVPNKDFIAIGKIASIEKDHKVVDSATKGQAVAMKIVGSNADEVQKSYGRHFDVEDELVSTISRKSIDLLKENYRDDLSRDEWILVVKLKKLFQIQ